MMKRKTYFKISIFLLEIIVLINFNVIVSALSTSKQSYGYKFRFTRYGDVDNCGKRKRNVENRKCFRQCQSDSDCKGSKRRCLCDGECGLSCVRITTSCSKVGEFKNGQVTYHPDNYFGGQLIYECNPGYTLMGDRMRTCEGDGWWSGSSPVCQKEMYCENIPTIANAIPNVQISNQSKYKTGTEIEYQCDIGFTSSSSNLFDSQQQQFSLQQATTTISSNKVVCQDDAKWSETKFQCIRINCGRPENIENGIINSNDFYYSSVIEYKCLPGYRIRNGDFLRECDLDGQWSGRKPTCEPVDCGEPPGIRNGQVSYNSTLLNSKAVYRCINSEKFSLLGPSSELMCMPNGRWSSPMPECIPKNCTLNATEYSRKVYNIFSSNEPIENYVYAVHTVIRVLCQPGYEIFGQTQLSCLTTNDGGADWNDKPPTCRQEVYCPHVSPPEYGLISSNKPSTQWGYAMNTTLEFTCVQGYRLETPPSSSTSPISATATEAAAFTSVSRICGPNGAWLGNDRIHCVPQTSTTTTTTKPPTTATTKWQTSTVAAAAAASTSISTTSAVVRMPHYRYEACKIDTTSIIISYANSINTNLVQSVNDFVFKNATIGNFIEHGSTVGYHCKANTLITYMAKCINGTLLMEQNCNELTRASKSPCSTPPKIPHGYNKYSSSLHGSKALYQCFNGYELTKGDGELKCVDGEWVGAIPICSKVNCAYPGPLENGKIYYIGTLSEYTYQPYMSSVGQNKQIRYDCERGYKLIGPSGSTCINGNWKPSVRLVKCVRDTEPSPPLPPLSSTITMPPSLVAAASSTTLKTIEVVAAVNSVNAAAVLTVPSEINNKVILYKQQQHDSGLLGGLATNESEKSTITNTKPKRRRLKKHKKVAANSITDNNNNDDADEMRRRRRRLRRRFKTATATATSVADATDDNHVFRRRRVHHEKKTYLNYY